MNACLTLRLGVVLLLATGGSTWIFAQNPITQIIRDGTIGSDASFQPLRGPAGVYEIGEMYGLRAGRNLFHSFSKFTVGTGDTALFTGNAATDNVIARVTGGPSSIDGRIRSTITGAALFFLNPAGVFFGSNASLDVRGSFHASTADVLRMKDADGKEFLAFSRDSLLRSATPSAFGFLTARPAPLTLDGSNLRVPNGYRLTLAGGDTELNRGRLTANGGTIAVAAVASPGEAVLDERGLNTDSFGALGNVVMRNSSQIDASEFVSEGAGQIAIRGGRFVVDSSKIAANAVDSSGGAIDIQIREGLTLTNGARVQSLTDGAGNAASIRVTADTIEISNRSRIESSTADEGNAGSITVEATRSIALSNPNPDPVAGPFGTGIASDVGLGGRGSGGQITIKTPSLVLAGAVISAESIGLGSLLATPGQPGSIRIQTNNLDMRNGALISNTSGTFNPRTPNSAGAREIRISPLDSQGPSRINLTGLGTRIQSGARESNLGGATISLEASDVSLSDRSQLTTTVFGGTADAGKIDITADRVSLSGGSEIQSDAQAGFASPRGRGGDITIQARQSISLESKEGLRTRVSTTAFGLGDGGRVSLTVQNESRNGTLLVDNSAIDSNNLSQFQGATGGKVLVNADIVRVENGGLIESTSSGPGGAGQVLVGARESLTVRGYDPDFGLPSAISSSTLGQGPAGNVTLSSPRIVIADGASVDSFTVGAGQGGDIRIGPTSEIPIRTQELVLQRGGKIFVSSIGSGAGNAGSVEVDVDRLVLETGGRIRADTIQRSNGAGGSITIRALESVRLNGTDPGDSRQASRIEVTTDGNGDAGRILVKTPELTIQDGAQIVAASNATGLTAGAAGSIFIGTADKPVHHLRISNGQISAFAAEGPKSGEPREGNITIISDGLVLMEHGGAITAGVKNGLGGDIAIGGPNRTVMRDGSRVLATTDIGTGGHIEIGGDVFIKTPDSVVSADAGVGNAGVVSIEAPQVDLQGGLTAPATSFLSASDLLQPFCEVRPTNQQGARFVVAGRRGLPLSPDDLLQAFDVTSVAQPVGATQGAIIGEATQTAQRSLAEGASAFRGGRFEEASQRWREAQTLFAGIGDPNARNDALRGLAQSQQALGLHVQSVDTLRQALALSEGTGDQARMAATFGSLGNAYLALGQSTAAEENLKQAVAITQKLGLNQLQANLLNNLGNLRTAQQSYAQAVEDYQRSAKLAQDVGDTLNEAQALSNAARAALEAGRPDQGGTLLGRVLILAVTLPETYEKTQLQIHIARSHQQLAETSPEQRAQSLLAAHKTLNEAVTAARGSGNARALSYALGNLAGLYQIEYRHEEALYLVRQALRAAERADAPELLYRWHWKAGQILWARGLAGPAIDSYRRAVEILEETRQEALSRYGIAELYFRKAVAPVYLDLVRALLQTSEIVTDASTSRQLLLDARETVERLKAAELRDYFRDECVADLEGRTTSPESVAPRTAVVYPVLLSDRLELLVTLPSGLRRYTVPVGTAAIGVVAEDFRRALQRRDSEEYLGPAQVLHKWLVEPYAEQLSQDHVETIVFVPDGALRTIPMAALHDGKTFLTERYALVVTPGLALVDPSPLLRKKPQVLLAGLSQSVQGQIALPAVESEIAMLHHIYGARPLLNEAFTTGRLERELTQTRPSIVHIASHARFTGDAETSMILTYDGRVTMDRLSQMIGVTKFRDDPLELLVLSACETAVGDERAALGLAGVALRAGARSALGSLWTISDAGTSELITRFYNALANPDASRAAALQRAQRDLIQNPRLRHPFYWSPFLIIGNWL